MFVRVQAALCALMCGAALGDSKSWGRFPVPPRCNRRDICQESKEYCRDWMQLNKAPEKFVVEYHMDKLVKQHPHQSSRGVVRIQVIREWAPPFADRMFKLAQFRVAQGGAIYRAALNKTSGWVIQFGMNGLPEVDDCWANQLISNETWSVHKPGNVKWMVSFSMGATTSPTDISSNPNCTATDYCAKGFSNEIYINMGNNSRLDAHDFAPFGYVIEDTREVVNRIYQGYGEVADLCEADHSRNYCHFDKDGKPLGVNMTRMNMKGEGRRYIRRNFPKITMITKHVLGR
mmetsp:Transcript_5974/g.9339  ORF Transcript_5974/g.9339 Transcript_5974/m.9339 type:complete len:289 (-) Transcript_5974:64-930(-)